MKTLDQNTPPVNLPRGCRVMTRRDSARNGGGAYRVLALADAISGELQTDAVRPSLDALAEQVASAIKVRGLLGRPLPLHCDCGWCQRAVAALVGGVK